ncbi:sensor histidine kinase [Streptomyces sp. NPDC049879]|uniref:sensor histidine kinase n=1 Tax=Streptomyces sp. NPDC049879 TaxID=3365598 RepID=UPI0037A32800
MRSPDPPSPPTPRVRAALPWCGAVAYPVALFLAMNAGPDDSALLRLLLTGCVTLLVVPLLGRHPLPALYALLAGTLCTAPLAPSWTLACIPVIASAAAVAVVAATRTRRAAFTAASTALAAHLATAWLLRPGQPVTPDRFPPDPFPPSRVPPNAAEPVTGPLTQGPLLGTALLLLLLQVTALVAGRALAERRAHAEALRARTASDAVTAERLRIAREVHDMIAHSVGVMAIQAGVGRRVIGSRPDAARDALASIEDTGRQTLAELRRTLGALRRDDGDGQAPGLAALPGLVAATSGAGVRVEVTEHGTPRPLPHDVDLAAYRIVQEALTNVARHAPGSSCRVVLDHGSPGDPALSLLVENDGPATPAVSPAPGYGITGMRERVTLLGGDFAAAPRPGGGFRVTARLPVPAAVA